MILGLCDPGGNLPGGERLFAVPEPQGEGAIFILAVRGERIDQIGVPVILSADGSRL